MAFCSKRKFSTIVVLLSTGLALSGCQTTSSENKKLVGTVLGGVAGAVVGAQFGSGTGRTVAMIAGGLAGAWIGSKLAEHLNEQDRQKLAENTQRAAATGQSQQWSNPDTGVKGSVKVKETRQETRPAKIKVLKSRVKTTPPLDFDPATFETTSNTNVRGGPGTDYVVVNSIKKRNRVEVLGKVTGKDWYLLSENGVGSGYVHASLLHKVNDQPTAVASAPAPASDVLEVQVASGQECRIVTQKITLKDGSEEAEDVTVCRGPDGWQMV